MSELKIFIFLRNKQEIQAPVTMKKPDLKQDEECEMEISSAIRRTKGIIKISPELGKEIAESDGLSSLES